MGPQAPLRIGVLNWLDRENPDAGGAELHLHETFGRMAELGHEVTLITSGWGAGEPARTRLDGMDVWRCGSRMSFPLHAARYLKRSAYGTGGFDVVVEDLNKAPLYTPLWCPWPVVLQVHHLFGKTVFREAAPPLAALIWLMEGSLGRMYGRTPTLAVSQSTADELEVRGFLPSRVHVIHNGVDLDLYRPGSTKTDTPTVLYLGRLKAYKRVDVLIEAVALLRDRGVPLRLKVAGSGDAEPALRATAEARALTDCVDFLGFVSEEDKVRLFQESWVHLFVSEKEGWGLTTLEAGACGTPTIASDAPGLRDSVVHGETGFLVPIGNPLAVADALEPLLSDSALRADVGRAATHFARQFTWARTSERTLGVLQERALSFSPSPPKSP